MSTTIRVGRSPPARSPCSSTEVGDDPQRGKSDPSPRQDFSSDHGFDSCDYPSLRSADDDDDAAETRLQARQRFAKESAWSLQAMAYTASQIKSQGRPPDRTLVPPAPASGPRFSVYSGLTRVARRRIARLVRGRGHQCPLRFTLSFVVAVSVPDQDLKHRRPLRRRRSRTRVP